MKRGSSSITDLVRKPQMIQAVTLASLNDAISVFDHESPAIPPYLEASDDGKNFRKIADIPFSSIVQRTASFDAVTARYFRLVFPAQPAGVVEHDHKITELVLSSGARVNEFEKRAGFANARDFYAIADPKVAPQVHRAAVGRDRPDRQDAARRHARLDAARRRLDGPAHRLFAHRPRKRPRAGRGDRPRSRQAEPRLREELCRRLFEDVCRYRGPGQ